MGPRATARGNVMPMVSTHGTGMLQWGREQLLAEMHRAPPRYRPAGSLQWGREQLLAEMPSAVLQSQSGFYASMGPRATARGNVTCGDENIRKLDASMGPRATARGNRPRSGRDTRASRASMGPRATARGN